MKNATLQSHSVCYKKRNGNMLISLDNRTLFILLVLLLAYHWFFGYSKSTCTLGYSRVAIVVTLFDINILAGLRGSKIMGCWTLSSLFFIIISIQAKLETITSCIIIVYWPTCKIEHTWHYITWLNHSLECLLDRGKKLLFLYKSKWQGSEKPLFFHHKI